jgi:4-aminobutyrate aminotransferase-like enzyme
MGNGYPIAGVVARADLVNDFRRQSMYFNTFAGNAVACAAGSAVLDVIERERLQDNARVSGELLRGRLRELQGRFEVIGDVRGCGLFTGVELVLDRAAKTPAPALAKQVVNGMRDRGVLISRIGPHDNVLKLRPPMPFAREHVDLAIATLTDTLASL